MKNILSVSVMLVVGSTFALPQISDVSLSQDPATRRVTVEYSLTDGPAVVTAEFTTNGVALPGHLYTTLSGDVNIIVTNREGACSFVWNPDNDFQAALGPDAEFGVRLTPWDVNDPPPYLVVDLCATNTFFFYASTNDIPDGIQHRRYKTDLLVMRKIPACNRRFHASSLNGEKGSRNSDFGHVDAEVPHDITLTNDFYMAIYEMTQKQFGRIYGSWSSQFSEADDSDIRPVEKITYNVIRGSTGDGFNWPSTGDAVAPESVVGILRKRLGINTFDLPTEAEWEFACRAGTDTSLNSGKNLDYSNVWGKNGPEACPALSEVAWWTGNSDGATHPVGLKRPNAFGLYDMHGNVLEHCLDWYETGTTYSDASHIVAPKGPVSSSHSKRVLRGGSYANYAPACRSASRVGWPFWDEKQVGFRLKCLPYFAR
ncbi:MAG: SUMF1/EgtB/PvdO family nonheme iron enzyme [Kiritimatiellae bacterium]|nr:SUMF1/EgtB/PvdO family nonheme iron enzyme [Kiritimatiellia bacterium]